MSFEKLGYFLPNIDICGLKKLDTGLKFLTALQLINSLSLPACLVV